MPTPTRPPQTQGPASAKSEFLPPVSLITAVISPSFLDKRLHCGERMILLEIIGTGAIVHQGSIFTLHLTDPDMIPRISRGPLGLAKRRVISEHCWVCYKTQTNKQKDWACCLMREFSLTSFVGLQRKAL